MAATADVLLIIYWHTTEKNTVCKPKYKLSITAQPIWMLHRSYVLNSIIHYLRNLTDIKFTYFAYTWFWFNGTHHSWHNVSWVPKHISAFFISHCVDFHFLQIVWMCFSRILEVENTQIFTLRSVYVIIGI